LLHVGTKTGEKKEK